MKKSLATCLRDMILGARKKANIYAPNRIGDLALDLMARWEASVDLDVPRSDVLGYQDSPNLYLAGISQTTERTLILLPEFAELFESDYAKFLKIIFARARTHSKTLTRERFITLLGPGEEERKRDFIELLDTEYSQNVGALVHDIFKDPTIDPYDLAGVILADKMEFDPGLALTVNNRIIRRNGVRLPKDFVALRKQMAFCSGSSINAQIASMEALNLPRGSIAFVPEGSFDPLFAVPGVAGYTTNTIAARETGFKLTAQSLAEEIRRVRQLGLVAGCLILTNPTNPFGVPYTRDELVAIAKVAIEGGVRIICDEHFAGLEHKGSPSHISYGAVVD